MDKEIHINEFIGYVIASLLRYKNISITPEELDDWYAKLKEEPEFQQIFYETFSK